MDDLVFQALLTQNLRSLQILSAIRASFDNFDEFYEIYAKEQEKKLNQIVMAIVSLIVGIFSVWVSISDFPLEFQIILIAGAIIVVFLAVLYYLVKYEWFSREKREFKLYFKIFDRTLSKLNELKFSIISTDQLIQIIKEKTDHFKTIPDLKTIRSNNMTSINGLFDEIKDTVNYLEEKSKKKEEYKDYYNEYYIDQYNSLKSWWKEYRDDHDKD